MQISDQSLTFSLMLNGESRKVKISPSTTLLDLIRDHLAMTGTKKGCDFGACGACTVLADGRRIKACVALAASYEGASITTIEGLASQTEPAPAASPSRVHQARRRCSADTCTPGQIMSAVALIGPNSPKDRDDHSRGDERQPVPLRGLSKHCRGDCGGRRIMTAPPFQYARPSGVDDALAAAAVPGAMYLAGGTDLLPLWKAAVVAPELVVLDISRLALNTITASGNGLKLGALARLSDVAGDANVVERLRTDSTCDRQQRQRPDPQHGDRRRQPAAANPLPVLPLG